jgi:hypothetical protein
MSENVESLSEIADKPRVRGPSKQRKNPGDPEVQLIFDRCGGLTALSKETGLFAGSLCGWRTRRSIPCGWVKYFQTTKPEVLVGTRWEVKQTQEA